MPLGLLLMAALASPVGIHVETSEQVDRAWREQVGTAFGRALTEHTGRVFVLDEDVWAEGCAQETRCVAGIRSRTRTEVVVLLSVLSGVTKRRLVVRLFTDDVAEERMELPADEGEWPALMKAVVAKMFLPGKAPVEAPALQAETEPPRDRVWTWVVGGTGLVMLATAIALGVSSRSARNTVFEQPESGTRYVVLRRQTRDYGLGANILFGLSGATLAAAVVLFFTE